MTLGDVPRLVLDRIHPAGPQRGPYVRRFARTAIHVARGGVFLCVTVLDRFGITAGTNAVDAALIGLYLLLAVGLLFDCFVLSAARLQIYLAVVAVGVASTLLNRSTSGGALSVASLLLMLVIYAPYVFSLRPGLEDSTAPARQFLSFAVVVALAGILQFGLQFVIHSAWLFDYTPLIPKVLRSTTGFNTVYSTGRFIKSNGFFLREPSGFSFMMALAIILEWSLERRAWRLALFGTGLLLSYAGTGFLALGIALLVPFNRRAVLRLLAAACFVGVVVLVLGEALNLTFMTDRVHEFWSPRSSGYQRYIAPIHLVFDTIDETDWTPFLGHGPGVIKSYWVAYLSHDPTWAKLLFEYGIAGFLAVCALCISALRNVAVPLRWRVVLFAAWLVMGGNLLSAAENALLLALLAFVPRSAPEAVPRSARVQPAPLGFA
jgi:hypothetical protein